MSKILLHYSTNGIEERERILDAYGISPIINYPSFGLFELSLSQQDELKNLGYRFQPIPNLDELMINDQILDKERLKFSAGGADRKLVWIIQFVGPIKEYWLEELKNNEVQIYGYIHPYSVFAFMHTSKAALYAKTETSLNGEKAINWLGRYGKDQKINPKTLGLTDLVVSYFPWAPNPLAQDRVNNLDLAESESVLAVEPFNEPKLLNSTARTVIRSDICHTAGCIGLNQIIGVTDTGIYFDHEVFSDVGKISQFIDLVGDSQSSGGDGHGHGTHVSGSAAGQAAPYLTYNKYDGQAFGAKLLGIKVFNNAGYWAANTNEYNFWKDGYLNGAKINSNSWGAATQGQYTSLDRNADLITSEYPEYVLTIAAGNEGPGAGTINSPSGSKNAIVVGATKTTLPSDLASFSSRGPTYDSRIKPDVLAPGSYITSALAQSITSYVSYQGTSMATPQVAGAVALLKQHFQDNSGPVPSASLLKALLINGAVEIIGFHADYQNEGKFPNNSQGWGRIDLSRSLAYQNPSRPIIFWDQLLAPTTGNVWTETVEIPENIIEVKFTLVWTDAAGVSGGSVNLVNNLNLEVTTPNGKLFLGNNFTGLNPGYSVESTISNVVDQRNNVEGVHLYEESFSGPIPTGTYQIKVISSLTTFVNKGFSLVVGYTNGELPPEPKKIALIGDYSSQIKTLLEGEGYTVDSYTSTQAPFIIINNYDGFVINKISNNSGFDNIHQSGKPIIFLGPYPTSTSGIGVLSSRTGTPSSVQSLWNKGPVTTKIVQSHPIFGARPVGNNVIMVNGGDNDYQTYDNYGTLIGQNVMSAGLTSMISVLGNKVTMGALGATSYTNVNHWTLDGKDIFFNALNFVLN